MRDSTRRVGFRVSVYKNGERGKGVTTYKSFIEHDPKNEAPSPEEWDDFARRACHLACVPGQAEACEKCDSHGKCEKCKRVCEECGGGGIVCHPSVGEAAEFNRSIKWETIGGLSKAVITRRRAR